MRPTMRIGWARWCAAILLALFALSALHAATPHNAAQRDCFACKALGFPGVSQTSGVLGRPLEEPSRIPALAPVDPPGTLVPLLRPLRAPPASPAL